MEECEICGAKVNDIYVVNVEEVELRVCTKCAKGKKVISKPSERRPAARRVFTEAKKSEELQIIENYGKVIHDAREAMKLPLKVLAEMLNEKETLLSRVEQQRTLPTVELAKKLEKALSIKLSEKVESRSDERSYGSKERATLGDFIGESK